jgi:hypothetical protein
MAKDARFAYLQARLQARHGDRPSLDDWRVVESSADLSHFLDALRRTPLKRWIGDINHEMEPEAIERQLRAAWREAVEQAADWSPEEWRPAVNWMRWLPELPAIDHLMRGAKVAPWMRADPVLRELAFDEIPRRREALAESPLAPLTVAEDHSAPHVADAWVAELRRRLPAEGRNPDGELAGILEHLRHHVEAMRGSDEQDGRVLRNSLAARIARRFRRGAGTAVALFSHLVLDGLELERVRAGVMARRLLPVRAEGRSWA